MDRDEFRSVLREVLQEELGLTEVQLAPRWRNGQLVLQPGNDSAPKTIPIDTLFHKIVMIRDKLRLLEAKVNANEKLSEQEKVQLQQYITQCYGSLTSFNVLFHSREEGFVRRSANSSPSRNDT